MQMRGLRGIPAALAGFEIGSIPVFAQVNRYAAGFACFAGSLSASTRTRARAIKRSNPMTMRQRSGERNCGTCGRFLYDPISKTIGPDRLSRVRVLAATEGRPSA
jgi:hypothetical protein